jgi:hypothetical protein
MELFYEIYSVLFRRQTVVEHSHIFMEIQTHKHYRISDYSDMRGTYTLENFRYISQIESIMRFRRCWQQFFSDFIVEIYNSIDQLRHHALDSIWESFEKILGNAIEYQLNSFAI